MAAVTESDVYRFAEMYVPAQQSAMRGGRRMKTRAEVRDDLKTEFPAIGYWLLWWAVRMILKRLVS